MVRKLWCEIGEACLSNAKALAESETALTADTARAVRDYVETAAAIDSLLTSESGGRDSVAKRVIKRLQEGKGLEPL